MHFSASAYWVLLAGPVCDLFAPVTQGPMPRQLLLLTQELSSLFTTHHTTHTQHHPITLVLALPLGNLFESFPMVGHQDAAEASGCAGPRVNYPCLLCPPSISCAHTCPGLTLLLPSSAVATFSPQSKVENGAQVTHHAAAERGRLGAFS